MANTYAEPRLNLRLYLARAILPPMPQSEPPDMFTGRVATPRSQLGWVLPSQPEAFRKLSMVITLQHTVRRKVTAFVRKYVSHTPVANPPVADPNDLLAYNRPPEFSIPAESFAIRYHRPAQTTDIDTLATWMMMPLTAANHVLRFAWPDTTPGWWRASLSPGPMRLIGDTYLCKTFYWMHKAGQNCTSYQLVVLAFLPWALGPDDMDDLVRCALRPAFKINPVPLNQHTRSHRIWAKLWDDCTRKQCPFFAISSYQGWVFGVFVNGWTVALLSETIMHSSVNPTVLEWLVFWMAAAMRLPGSYVPPLRPEINPDIRDSSNVATKLSLASDEYVPQHTEWLEKNHRQDRVAQIGCEMDGLTNTWFMGL